MAELGGAEKMPMSAFVSTAIPRASPLQWSDPISVLAPKVSPPSSTFVPAPNAYDPATYTVDRTVGRAATRRWLSRGPGVHGGWGKGPLDPDEFAEDQAERAAFHLMMHPPGATVTSYSPQLLPNGKEWNMADLNGAELMPMSSFTSMCKARAPPDVWADPLDSWATSYG